MTDLVPPNSLPDTVLVVDDEPAILRLLELALKRVGLPTKLVGTAEEAIELLDRERFGAVVTDKNLPGKSGLEVIKETKTKQPYCAVIMVTGYVSTDSVLEAMRLGANEYLVKPFTDLMLVAQRVKSAIEHQRTDFERALLADTLRSMEKTVRRQKEEAFQRKTELDLFQSVLEVRVEDALAPLREQVQAAEAQLARERARRKKTRGLLVELAGTLSAKAPEAEESQEVPEPGSPLEVAARLRAEAEMLGEE